MFFIKAKIYESFANLVITFHSRKKQTLTSNEATVLILRESNFGIN